MKKLEMIYREILYRAIEEGRRSFVQKDLAGLFGCSLSTVFHALDAPRSMGAVRASGRGAEVIDIRKLLIFWATRRRLSREVIFESDTSLPVLELEGQMPPSVVYGAFSAYRLRFGEAPADYGHVYIYAPDPQEVRRRLRLEDGRPTRAPKARTAAPSRASRLTVLAADPFLVRYGTATTLGQTFADLWALPQWYARDFANAILERLP